MKLHFRLLGLLSFSASVFVFTSSVFATTSPYNPLLKRVEKAADLGQSIPLTGSTFDLITQKGAWFIKFYAPWCPHCQHLAPFWKSLSEEFKEAKNSSDFHFGEVNCDVEDGLRNKFDIKGYPTLLLFHDGKKVDEYLGATNTDVGLRPYIESQISKYVSAKNKLKVFDLTALSQEDKAQLSAPLSFRTFTSLISTGWNFVRFTSPDCPHCEELEKAWYQLAEENPSYKLSQVDCNVEQKLCKSESVIDVPKLKLFKDGKFIDAYPNNRNRTVADLKEFIESYFEDNSAASESGSKPLSDTWETDSEQENNSERHMRFSDRTTALTLGNFNSTIKDGIWFVLFKIFQNDNRGFAYVWYHLSSDFSEFHTRYGVRFATVDCALENELCQSMRVGDKLTIQTFHLGVVASTYNKSLSYDILKPYIRDQVYQFKRSTEFPLHYFANQRKPNPDGKLMTLQDNVFDMLTDNGPWFVFFKSNRCPDCRASESDWEKLATQFQGSVNIAMVQCAIETELCSRLGISSYPYLRFFKDGVPRDYNGPIDFESLFRFTSAASMPQVHMVTKSSVFNIHHRESSYFLYIYEKAQDLEALEPILKGKYLLLDIYAISLTEYNAAGLIPPTSLPHFQAFHNDILSASFPNALVRPAQIQQWLVTTQYSNVTALDSTNFDLVMDQNDVVALAVVDPLKDASAITQFDAAAIGYGPPNGLRKPTFALIDGIKWQEYINRVYQKSLKDLHFVTILHPKSNWFKLTSNDDNPISFHGESLYKELDLTLTLPRSKPRDPPGLTFTTYMLLLFLCGLALFLFISYRQHILKKKFIGSKAGYDHLSNQV